MKKRFAEMRLFNYRLWISLCALALIPAIYQTVKTSLISSVAQAGAFDIIGQMEWFDLINETLQAFLIIPLYSILNRIFKNHRETFAEATFKTGLFTFVLYTLFSLGVLVYGSVLIQAMNPGEIDLSTASVYLRLETVAFMLGILVSFANVVFVVIGNDKNVYIFLGIRTVLSVIADFLLIPYFGIYGVAVSNMITNTLLSVACAILLCKQGYIRLCLPGKADGELFREWGKIGALSGLQQFVDNFIYAVMVCKMVNMVAEQGNYWIANNFIWGWLLIPITALAEVIRADCKEGYKQLHMRNYYLVAVAGAAIWAVTIPAWTPFFRYVQNLENAHEIFMITLKLMPFYVAYAGCAIIDNVFVGLGKTGYTAVNSLIINLGYYGVFYILSRTNVINFDMNTIILMFGFGMVAHLAVSLTEEKLIFRKKTEISSDNTKPQPLENR